jgi:hypothetical protein
MNDPMNDSTLVATPAQMHDTLGGQPYKIV